MSDTIVNRLMTYHILREELMKTEDELRGRQLQDAWVTISKVKLSVCVHVLLLLLHIVDTPVHVFYKPSFLILLYTCIIFYIYL